jgi:hypothetical protein
MGEKTVFKVMNQKSTIEVVSLVGLAGFEPVTFARNHGLRVISTGFSIG